MKRNLAIILLAYCLLVGCDERAWNDPYPQYQATDNILYTAFSERPKHLDPAVSFNEADYTFIAQIYEPPLQYNYLARPYTLEPLTAASFPTEAYDAKTNTTTYTIIIKPGIMYQPHQVFARGGDGELLYHDMGVEQIRALCKLADLPEVGTRELLAVDYVYQLKRLADPKLNSPVYGLLQQYMPGLRVLRDELTAVYAQHADRWIDLRNYELPGVKLLDEYTYQITIQGRYPQFKYWFAMLFFAPMPWEAMSFYAQAGLEKRNITIDWYPVGTGAFYLTENNPERRMVMTRNPNFHEEYYPAEGGELAGKRLPLLDQVVFSLEKESIPYWDKFMQGYYDRSGISSDIFNSVINAGTGVGATLNEELTQRGIKLNVSTNPSVFYWGGEYVRSNIRRLYHRCEEVKACA